jgi:predicted Zn-dependent protease
MRKAILSALSLFIMCSLTPVFATGYSQCVKSLNDGDFAKSRECFRRYLVSNPQDAAARFYFAQVLEKNREYTNAIVQYEFFAKSYPKTKLAKFSLEQIEIIKNRIQTLEAQKRSADTYLSDLGGKVALWENTPIRVWVQKSPYSEAARNAVKAWQTRATDVVPIVMVSDEKNANIKIYFVSSVKEFEELGSTEALGFAKCTVRNGILQDAEIYVLTTNKSSSTQISPTKAYRVLLHEIGHALGILGHSKNENDVMFHSNDRHSDFISTRDINTLKAIYGK